jgi:hypothetical protein
MDPDCTGGGIGIGGGAMNDGGPIDGIGGGGIDGIEGGSIGDGEWVCCAGIPANCADTAIWGCAICDCAICGDAIWGCVI